MWNGLTISYAVVAAAALALVGVGAWAGVRLAADYPDGAPAGSGREEFDRRHALVSSLVHLGIAARLVLVPLWFAALSSLVPLIPGGMCLAAVHHLGGVDAWAGSALQGVVPALLLFWAALDRADRRRDDERLLRTKLAWLVPVLVAVAAESAFDVRFFWGLELGPSPCCMTLFDGAIDPLGPPATGWMTTWVAAAAGLGFGGCAAVARGGEAPRPIAEVAAAALAVLAAGALVFAMHDALGSHLMHTPSHRCLFCALRLEPEALMATALACLGAWLAAARVGLAAALRGAGERGQRARFALPAVCLGAAVVLVAAGA